METRHEARMKGERVAGRRVVVVGVVENQRTATPHRDCRGSQSSARPRPVRVIVFGGEFSLPVTDHRAHSVIGRSADPVVSVLAVSRSSQNQKPRQTPSIARSTSTSRRRTKSEERSTSERCERTTWVNTNLARNTRRNHEHVARREAGVEPAVRKKILRKRNNAGGAARKSRGPRGSSKNTMHAHRIWTCCNCSHRQRVEHCSPVTIGRKDRRRPPPCLESPLRD
ncbi:uncharacterized protein LOC143211583 isoform X2 [Lasioglossum baleicum]|uniref:uncharacterized protein LOC143211583 isoform X2 n=1 Tax=Lasioglossum baleicum TaxID=434251 RepID=UPI003FCED651